MKKTDLVALDQIERRIYMIRGQKVMLDRDLAALYGVETRVLNQAVTRNNSRFPEDFAFTLARDEIMSISQSVISSAPTLKFAKKVTVFTEQGVAMLSSVLNSERAIEVNIAIMRAFVRLREFLASQARLGKKLRDLERQVEAHHESIHVLFEAIQQLTSECPPAIGFQYISGEEDGIENGKVREKKSKYRTRKKRKSTKKA